MSEDGEGVPAPVEQTEVPEFEELASLPFEQLRIGSQFRVLYSVKPDDPKLEYDVRVTGVRKDGLMVNVYDKDGNLQYKARCPGGIKGSEIDVPATMLPDYGAGPTPGVLKVSTETELNRFYLQNLHTPDGQKSSSALSTAPIRQILVKK